MREPILVLNAGSSSVKFAVFETRSDGSLAPQEHGEVSGIGIAARLDAVGRGGRLVGQPIEGQGHETAIAAIHTWLSREYGDEAGLSAVGHRVVHGGGRFVAPVRIDAEVIAELEALVPLAPLHQPHHIAAIRAIAAAAPNVPQVACFDTAFHRTQPRLAQLFGLPRAFAEKGVRRYGFHGISHEYIVSVLPLVAPEVAGGRLVIAHLGNGASLCALSHGRSIATTMAFTPVEGLIMGTRSGTLDPGVILYLLQHERMNAAAIERLVYEQSGLLGVSGMTSDMRALLASTEAPAREAVDLFVYRVGRELGSLAAALGGLDGLVFTGGIGEHAAEIRARVCRDAGWLGVGLDEAANAAGGPRISPAGAAVSAWVVPTDENLMIARHTRRLLDGSGV